MKDGTRELTNNQWLLKADADKLPATYAELVTLLTGAGLPFGRTLLSDGWTIEPDPLNKANLLTDATAAKYGITPTATVNDALARAVNPTLIQSYLTAGTYTWAAPDRNGDGSDYEIGVLIIGGGGSGGVYKWWDASGQAVAASGGGSGYLKYIKMIVTPNNTYTVVVGSGGASVSSTSATVSSVAGNAGSTSAFDGNIANGGQGGKSSAPPTSGANGGQGSDNTAGIAQSDFPRLNAPYGGATPVGVISSNSYENTPITIPSMCVNPFTGEIILGAGGGAYGYNIQDYTAYTQAAPYIFPNDGVAGAAKNVYNIAANQIGNDATATGCGGGATVFTGNTSNTVNTATSGRGADGAVLIYA